MRIIRTADLSRRARDFAYSFGGDGIIDWDNATDEEIDQAVKDIQSPPPAPVESFVREALDIGGSM